MTEHLTAEQARKMYQPDYTLDEILRFIEGRARESKCVYGYNPDRFNPELRAKLEELGYIVEDYVRRQIPEVSIRWDEEENSDG